MNLAAERGLAAVAITDHDTVDGVAEAVEAGREAGIEVVPGLELSSRHGRYEPHILGFFIDYTSETFRSLLERLKKDRLERAGLIVEKLRALGVEITIEQVLERSGPGTVGRMHIAQIVHANGFSPSVQEAFGRYVGRKRPAFVERHAPSTRKAIDAIVAAGGVPVLAHPGHLRLDPQIAAWASWGLRGLEVYHTDHRPEQSKRYAEMAERLGMIVTGGSDCHGFAKSEPMLGNVTVPYSTVEALRQASGAA